MPVLEQDRIIESLQAATSEVFSTMLPISIETTKSYVEKSSAEPVDGVVALVGFTGPWVGTGSISCSATLACRLCAVLLMTEAEAVNDEVLDAVGEVANMIIGNYKTHIESYVGDLGLSIPTVIYGKNFTARSLNTSEWVAIEFNCEGEPLHIKVCMTPNPDSKASARPTGINSAAVVA